MFSWTLHRGRVSVTPLLHQSFFKVKVWLERLSTYEDKVDLWFRRFVQEVQPEWALDIG